MNFDLGRIPVSSVTTLAVGAISFSDRSMIVHRLTSVDA